MTMGLLIKKVFIDGVSLFVLRWVEIKRHLDEFNGRILIIFVIIVVWDLMRFFVCRVI